MVFFCFQKMPFYYKGGKRQKVSPDRMRNAVKRVLEDECSIRSVAKEFNVDRKTLGRYVEKIKDGKSTDFQANHVSNQIFSNQQEEDLVMYFIQACKLNYGMTSLQTRKFVYDYANALAAAGIAVRIPENWHNTKAASYDWLRGFLHRNNNLSLRVPESTSIGRSVAFNRTTVEEFFCNLREVYSRRHYEPQDVYNVDETGVLTVQRHGKIIAPRGEKQVSKVTSEERGTLVTMCATINALGTSLPPFFIFPRKRLSERMKSGPPGSQYAVHESGWMTGVNFEAYMKFFINFTKCSTDKPVVVILDNHESHIYPPVLQLCKDNGITLVTLPPHTSHKLQPLDIAVFGPFKTFYNQAADDFMSTRGGERINIYDIPNLVAVAFPRAFNPINIQKGFQCTGIWPLDSNTFTAEDFLSSQVTYLPEPENQESLKDASPVEPLSIPSTSTAPSPVVQSTKNAETSKGSQTTMDLLSTSTGSPPVIRPSTSVVSPLHVRPFPKYSKKVGSTKRKRTKSRILTDTPIKESIETNYADRHSNKISSRISKRKISPGLKQSVKRAMLFNSEDEDNCRSLQKSPRNESMKKTSSTESWYCIVCREDRVADMRPCFLCQTYVHEECVGLTVNDKEKYVCWNCETN